MLQNYAEAFKDCLSALEGDSGLVKLYVRGARAAVGLGKTREAVELLSKGVEVFTIAREANSLDVVMKEVLFPCVMRVCSCGMKC